MRTDPKELAAMVAAYTKELLAQGIDPYIGLQLAMNYQILVVGQQDGAIAAPGWPSWRKDDTTDPGS